MNEEIKSAYETWLAQPNMPADLADELNRIAGSEDAITDRFYRELEFGTGGLRGVIGAGTNRMNIYNIRKATQGLANYLNASGLPKKVAIGYDSRIKSDVFARETAAVLAANGIKAYIYPRLEPTPALSWAVRYYGCGADGKPRQLHIPQALDVTERKPPVAHDFHGHLAQCDYFTVDALEGDFKDVCDETSFTSLLMLEGVGTLTETSSGESLPIRKGESLFVPDGLPLSGSLCYYKGND